MDALLQSINQSVSQSINRSNNRSKFKQWQTTVPNKRSINESIYQPDESMTQWINKSMNQWINKSIHPSIHQSINPLVIESINESMHQCVNQWINKSMMHACLPACLAGFFFSAASLSLSLSLRLRVRASPCVSLYVSLFFVYVWPFSWSIALSATRTLLDMTYLWYLLAALVSRFLLERRCTGILGFGRLAGFLLSKEREHQIKQAIVEFWTTENASIHDVFWVHVWTRCMFWCFLSSGQHILYLAMFLSIIVFNTKTKTT